MKIKSNIVSILLVAACISCTKKQPETSPEPIKTYKNEIIVDWTNFILKTIKAAPKNSPTYCARAIGYIGLTMHESVCHGDASSKTYLPLVNNFPINSIPQFDNKLDYNWNLSYNSAVASIFKNMYSYLPIQTKIDSMESAMYVKYATDINASVISRSVNYGKDIASVIYDWSLTDGGNEAYTNNFPSDYSFVIGDGHWVLPTKNAQSLASYPLLSHWGQNRTFIAENSQIAIPEKEKFSTDTSSRYYKNFLEVYQKNMNLTAEEKEIALWWGDDPVRSFSPAGHSFNLSKILLKDKGLNLFDGSALMAQSGIALADAFIVCWKAKYFYNSERPSSFVNKYIDANWLSFWPEPLFPAFPSGHSTQIGAATKLCALSFGDQISLIDSSNVGIPADTTRKVSYLPRKYNSFTQIATECANSRLYGGIHTKDDNNAGLSLGQKIGQNVYNKLH